MVRKIHRSISNMRYSMYVIENVINRLISIRFLRAIDRSIDRSIETTAKVDGTVLLLRWFCVAAPDVKRQVWFKMSRARGAKKVSDWDPWIRLVIGLRPSQAEQQTSDTTPHMVFRNFSFDCGLSASNVSLSDPSVSAPRIGEDVWGFSTAFFWILNGDLKQVE